MRTTRAERKAAAEAWSEKQRAAFYAKRCECGAQATVFVIRSEVDRRGSLKAVTRQYCDDHSPRAERNRQ